MEINSKKIKTIRPMTDKEIEEYTRNRNAISSDKPIFCIEFDDNSILLPKFDCIKCMENDICLFSLIKYL